MIAGRGPWQADAVMEGEDHAPLVAVLALGGEKEAPRAHVRPKGVAPGTLGHFSCKTATSEGAEVGRMGAAHGPPQLPATNVSAAELVGEGRAPVVAVLLASAQEKADAALAG
jgi:hypothetical protein